MKAVIDSKGKLVAVPDKQSIIRFMPLESKEKALNALMLDFIEMAKQCGYSTNEKDFVFLAQPFYSKEQLLFFTRTEFSSSSQTVKIANGLKQHPEVIEDINQLLFFKSIFSCEEDRIRWYFLSVGGIEVERNLFDCKKIDIQYLPPIPFAVFCEDLHNKLITNKEMLEKRPCLKYKFLTSEIDINKGKALVKRAFDCNIIEFNNKFSQVIEKYKSMEYAENDSNSNKATYMLSILNNTENIYPIYKELKNYINKNFKNATVQYKKNEVIVGFNGNYKYSFFISGGENPQFIINGNIVDIETLKHFIITNNFPQEPIWYNQKVKPYINIY